MGETAGNEPNDVNVVTAGHENDSYQAIRGFTNPWQCVIVGRAPTCDDIHKHRGDGARLWVCKMDVGWRHLLEESRNDDWR